MVHIPGILMLTLQFHLIRITGEIADTGEELIRPVSGLVFRLTWTIKLQELPPQFK